MTFIAPGFTLKPVCNRTVGALVGANTKGLILHVQAGNGPLDGWFNNPAAQASATWWAGKTGGRQQYGDPDHDKFWAQAAGNPDYHSVETEGVPSEPLTAEQIETVAVLFAAGHARYGWPLVLAEKPGDPGLGWHGMGGTAWGGHTGCPGDVRKAQRAAILARAKQIANPQEDTLSAAEVNDIKDYVRALLLDGYDTAGVHHPGLAPVAEENQRRITAITQGLAQQAAAVAALTSAVQQVASKPGQQIDLLAVQKAAADGAAAAIKNISVTVEGA